MKTLIQREADAARERRLKTSYSEAAGRELVELSQDNVVLVESFLLNDSAFMRGTDKKNRKSTAYCMACLKEALTGKAVDESEYRECLINAISAVDRDNSTHLNADKVGKEEIFNRLFAYGKDRLLNSLANGDLELIDLIAAPTHPTGVSQNGNKYKARINLSYASKFCHYACFYFFEGKKEQDNYSIWDSVVTKALPLYIRHYGIGIPKIDSYEIYQLAIDDIIRRSRARISRNGFDHLVWFYFKGRV